MSDYKSMLDKRDMLKLSYLESDLEILSRIIDTERNKFNESLHIILNRNENLLSMYNSIHEVENENDGGIVENEVKKEVEVVSNPIVDDNIKSIYRKLVKLTHPDKTGDVELNDVYLNIQNYYNSGDVISIYKICDDLGVDYDIDDDIRLMLSIKLIDIENDIDVIKQNFIWRWIENSYDDDIILEYLYDMFKIKRYNNN